MQPPLPYTTLFQIIDFCRTRITRISFLKTRVYKKNMTYQHTRRTRKIIFQHSTLIIHCALHTQTSTQRIQKSYSTLTTIRNSYRQLPFSLRFFINYILEQRTLSLQVSISLTSALSSAYLKTDISSLLYRHRRSPPLSYPPYSRIALPVYRR